ncbi:MAG: TetR/AcrR family transcriptional regulator [Desulfarculaceae bacterium]|nr:TetR/AcrR family transcriptional regulator [Desulfarculaceae bacterium]MCF8072026.1 TetR/AcrR family transcriptional regulator [Desulfarculaceae bacterium]MCF8101543.1 TetR/AcrR family transcriptional regulator [Desulfarculaceae bacterium]MCF8115093.1 TetR/AcrR family transcriptional regulator [Desulfarculaceae bacterium]
MSEKQEAAQGKNIPTEVKDNDLVARRRRQIVDAAVHLFIRKGFHKTTTREIAKAAGFSIGTLYEYVTSKEDVLYLVCQAIHSEMEQRLTARLRHGINGARDLEAAIAVYFTVCDQMSDHILLIYQETKSLPAESRRFVLEHEVRITGVFKELLARGVSDFSLRPLSPPEIELVAHNIMVVGHMWAFRRWALAESFNLEQYIELQSDYLLGELT